MSKKARFVLYILGAIFLVSSIFGFSDSIGTGFLTLFVGLVLVSIPTVFIVRKKQASQKNAVDQTQQKLKALVSEAEKSPNAKPTYLTDAPPETNIVFTPAESKNGVRAISITPPSRSDIPSFYYSDLNVLRDLPDSYVVVDVETTGLYPTSDRLTEIGAVRVVNRQIGDQFSSLIACTVPIPAFVSQKTGITSEMLLDAPPESEVVQRLFSFVGNLPVAAYKADFDLGFLHYAAHRIHLNPFNCCFDVLDYARKNLPHDLPKKLESVSAYLRVDSTQYHRALADAVTTARVAEAIRPIVAENERKKQLSERIAADAAIDYKSFSSSGEIDPNSPLLGKRVVFSGLLSRMSRRDACQIVADLGGQPWGSVTKGTAFLVTGEGEENAFADTDGVSYKMRQAEEWRKKGSSIRTITESEFFELIGL